MVPWDIVPFHWMCIPIYGVLNHPWKSRGVAWAGSQHTKATLAGITQQVRADFPHFGGISLISKRDLGELTAHCQDFGGEI